MSVYWKRFENTYNRNIVKIGGVQLTPPPADVDPSGGATGKPTLFVDASGKRLVYYDTLGARQLVPADRANYFELFTDFESIAGSALPLWLSKQDTSAAGTVVADFVANAAGGQYKILCDNTNEVQKVGLNGGDHLTFDITKKPILECRLKIQGTSGAALSAVQRFVVGFASARNATLDSITTSAWLRVTGDASTRAVIAEADDNTTDTNAQSTGFSYTDDTFFTVKIDASSLAGVKFYINGALKKTIAMAAATGNVQPFIELQKDSGTATPAFTVDWLRVTGAR